MKTHPRVVDAICNMPWAIQPEKLQAIAAFIDAKENGSLSVDEFEAAHGPSSQQQGAIGVLPLFGIISHRANMLTEFSGGTSLQKFGAQFRQMVNEPSVSAIVIEVDSPGGGVFGLEEMADEIRAARDVKPIIAVANGMAASAAYWLASSATEVVVTPSSQVGSIGILGIHQDFSKAEEDAGVKTTIISRGKFKTEGNEHEPLTDEAKDAMQAKLDEYYAAFITAVAKGRDVKPAAVRDGFGQGRVVGAKEAKALGMVDRIDTLEGTIHRLSSRRPRRNLAAEKQRFEHPTV